MGRPDRERGGARGRRRRARGQAGASLIETIVALVLASVVVLALAGGMLTLMRTSEATSRTQRMQAALTTSAEAVKAASYVDCAAPADYDGAPGVDDPADDVEVTVTGVEYWDGVPVAGTPPAPSLLGSFVATCPPDLGAQRVAVRVTLDGDSDTAQIVKRRITQGATP
jgi:type II secretory pathway pseudopilin PulG